MKKWTKTENQSTNKLAIRQQQQPSTKLKINNPIDKKWKYLNWISLKIDENKQTNNSIT